MNLKIRQATINDYDDICELAIQVYKLHINNRPDFFQNVDNPFPKDRLEELLNYDDTKIFVAEDTETQKVVAYSTVQITTTKSIPVIIPSRITYINDFCVSSAYHKKGIGKRLFSYIIDYAKSENTESVQLTVWDFNEKAIKFYESMGMSTMNRKLKLNLK